MPDVRVKKDRPKVKKKPLKGTAFILGTTTTGRSCSCQLCQIHTTRRAATAESTGNHGSFHGTGLTAARGFIASGYDVRLLSAEKAKKNILPRELTQRTPFKGDTTSVRAVYARIFKDELFPNIDVPELLKPLAGRWMREGTMGELRHWVQTKELPGFPGGKNPKSLFVKPLIYAKDFGGCHIENKSDMGDFGCIPDNYPLLIQEYVSMDNESRFFVLDGKVLNKQDETGWNSSTAVKKNALAEEVAAAWKDGLGAYAVDIGLGEKGALVVEVNSMLTSGHLGGLSDEQVGQCLVRAWESYMAYGRTGNFQGAVGKL